MNISTQELKSKSGSTVTIPVVDEPQVYSTRWVILILFVFLSASNAMQWIQYSIISPIVREYYGVSTTWINMTSLIYMILYIPFIFPGSYLLEKLGFRLAVTLGALGTCLGSWIKLASVSPTSFYIGFAGQSIVGLSQIFIISVPARLAAIWFGPDQVSSACSIGVFGNQEKTTDDLVQEYFSLGFQQKEILAFLQILHKRCISLRTLKRILAKLHLYRKKNYSKMEDVVHFMEQEIEKSSHLHGYRWCHLKCIQNNLVVTQDIVRELLWYLNHRRMETRKKKRLQRRQYRNKGPNYLWHMDSYDKLKPYGICINGCIDGFSRHIIWLRAGLTSSDSKVIAGYYLNSIKMLGGCPKSMKCDMGTENAVVETFQKGLHELFNNNSPSNKPPFMYGKSCHNQRIEAWWGILRKQNSQFWMNLFQMLKDEDLFDGSFLDKSLIQYRFMDIIQKELDQIVLEWNVHKIRPSRNSISPSGRPCIMFEMPSLYGTQSYLLDVPNFAFEAIVERCKFHKYPCDKDFYNLCNLLMIENNISHKNDPYHAVEIYQVLRRLTKEIFDCNN